MMQTKLALSLITVALLSACGGGGGNDTKAPTLAATPTSYSFAKPSEGDYSVKKHTSSDGTSTYSRFDTVIVGKVKSDGSYETTDVSSSYSRHHDIITADGKYTTDSDGSVSNCSESPDYDPIPLTYKIGQTWSSPGTITHTCTDFERSGKPRTWRTSETNEGTVTGIESITVAAGTFNALKISIRWSSTVIERLPNDTLRGSKGEITGWLDTVSGEVVKVAHIDTSLGDSNISAITVEKGIELIGYTNAATKTGKPAIERFTGNWRAIYTGGTTGTCNVIASPAGVITGTCTPTGGTAFAITGAVDIQGNVALDPTPALGTGFSGKMTSPLEGSGKTQVGTWTIQRQ